MLLRRSMMYVLYTVCVRCDYTLCRARAHRELAERGLPYTFSPRRTDAGTPKKAKGGKGCKFALECRKIGRDARAKSASSSAAGPSYCSERCHPHIAATKRRSSRLLDRCRPPATERQRRQGAFNHRSRGRILRPRPHLVTACPRSRRRKALAKRKR